MVDYEKELLSVFDRLGVDEDYRSSFLEHFNLLREFDKYKWEHSIRVGLGCEALVGKYFPDWPIGTIVLSAYLHDVGVLDVEKEVVNKTNMTNSNFTDDDYEKIKTHVVEGYNMIVDDFPDEARIMLFHHMKSREYPEILPERSLECRINEDDARKYGRLVELVDFADSLNRDNGRFGKLDREGRKKILLECFSDYKEIIGELYRDGVFT